MVSHTGSPPFVKECCLELKIYRIAHSQGSGLYTYFVADSQEHHDLTYRDTVRTKDSCTKKFAIDN